MYQMYQMRWPQVMYSTRRVMTLLLSKSDQLVTLSSPWRASAEAFHSLSSPWRASAEAFYSTVSTTSASAATSPLLSATNMSPFPPFPTTSSASTSFGLASMPSRSSRMRSVSSSTPLTDSSFTVPNTFCLDSATTSSFYPMIGDMTSFYPTIRDMTSFITTSILVIEVTVPRTPRTAFTATHLQL